MALRDHEVDIVLRPPVLAVLVHNEVVLDVRWRLRRIGEDLGEPGERPVTCFGCRLRPSGVIGVPA